MWSAPLTISPNGTMIRFDAAWLPDRDIGKPVLPGQAGTLRGLPRWNLKIHHLSALVRENLPVTNGQIRSTIWLVPRKTTPQVPELLRGTVVTHRRRCGKPNCRCANGEALHEQVLLSYSLESRARSVTLPQELIEPVRQAAERYRQARLRLEAQGNSGLEALVRRLKRPR